MTEYRHNNLDLDHLILVPASLLLHEILSAKACNFTKSITPPWVFVTFFILLQMVQNCAMHHTDDDHEVRGVFLHISKAFVNRV